MTEPVGIVSVQDASALPTAADARGIGIDVGGTSIKWACTVGTQVTQTGRLDTPRPGGTALVSAIAGLVRDLDPDASTVGVAVPGLVDTRTRSTIFIPNIPGSWDRYPLAVVLEEQTGRRVSLLNDARAFGHAELIAGAGRGLSNVLFLTLGTGVGGAVARDGGILMGDVDSIGEMGHVTVEANGELCGCGGRGCLETVASGSALVGALARATKMSLSPVLSRLTGGDLSRLTPEVAARAAAEGDHWSLNAFAHVGRSIGLAAGNACLILQLTDVVIGGGLAGAFDFIAPHVRATLSERRSVMGDVSVHRAGLGSEAGAIGAALYAQLDTMNSAGKKDSP